MYLKRKIDEYLLEWKRNEERLPVNYKKVQGRLEKRNLLIILQNKITVIL